MSEPTIGDAVALGILDIVEKERLKVAGGFTPKEILKMCDSYEKKIKELKERIKELENK